MLRMLLPTLGLMVCAAASFTAWKAPTLLTWKIAILAGEFGHFLVVIPLGIAVAVWMQPAETWRWVQCGTLVTCALATGLFLKPSFQARTIARELPARLERAFGSMGISRVAFSPKAWLGDSVDAVKPEPRIFAHAGTADALTLDFYRAAGRSTPAPCVIVVHGGGWDGGDRTQLPALNSRLARRGFAVAAVSYRLAPKHVWPAQRDDVRAALAYLKAHAGELGVDATRFVILGRSAGGQVAQTVAYDEPDPGVRGLISLYGPADLHFAWKHTTERDILDSFSLMKNLTGGTPETVQEKFDSASPYLRVGPRAVPTLLMHGKIDSLVWHRQSERLAQKLNEAGVPCVFLDLPWATHAFDFNLHGPSGQLSTFAIEWFVEAVTR